MTPAEIATRVIGRNLSTLGVLVVEKLAGNRIVIRIGLKRYKLTVEEEL